MIAYDEYKPVILTKEISTRQLSWRNDMNQFRWFRQYSLISRYNQDRWEEKINTDPTIEMFCIDLFDDGGPFGMEVGTCGLTSIDKHNQVAEFSLFIRRDYQGKGYGSRALKTLLRHGFEDFNLNRIYGETFDGNLAAKMFEKIGLKKEGTLRETYFKRGRFIDSHIYAALRSEWNG